MSTGLLSTYKVPMAKTPNTAILAPRGMRRPKKIQKGSARTITSIKIVRDDWIIWKLLSMHLVLTSFLNSECQFVSIGTHWNRAAKKMAIA